MKLKDRILSYTVNIYKAPFTGKCTTVAEYRTYINKLKDMGMLQSVKNDVVSVLNALNDLHDEKQIELCNGYIFQLRNYNLLR